MKVVKLFDDYLAMAAASQNMSKEEYAAYYMAEKSMIREADHEVGMALGQLEAICDSAIELQEKIGTVEINLPGWIQDHISQSYNYIKQANDGYHVLDEKTISIDWEDDENALVFSDAGMVKVDYDGEFQYRGKWFSTVDHTGPEDLLKDLNKAFKSDKFVYVNESYKLIKEATDKPYLDGMTGLIYYFNIPFTSEDMEELLGASKAILNAKFTPNKQFEIQPMIFIKDKVNGGEHTFSVAQIGILGAFYDKNKNNVASRKDF
jgi:hypothetical protein